jgi:two-component sensor histidine kinase
MSDASNRRPGDSVRELLLGMGGSSMRKSYYPQLRGKLDDLELFHELVEHSMDAILLFSLPANRLLFANLAACTAFAIGEIGTKELGIQDVLSQASEAGYPDCTSFIQKGQGESGARRFEVVVNEVIVVGNPYAIAVARDSTERLFMEERIRQDLLEKETMLREIHHRVKNNFQLMKSLLALEASTIEDEKVRLPLLESENRIMSMAGAHERLYESPDLSHIDARGYFEDIVSAICISFGELFPRAGLEFSCDDLALSLETALPCGLILNELLSNCLKHAFPRPNDGPESLAKPLITVRIGREAGGMGSILVADNGVGIDAAKLEGKEKTIGIMLVKALVVQLKGSVSWKVERGTSVAISFPLLIGHE